MKPKAEQVEAVRALVRESVSAVDAIAPSVLRKLGPALRQAREELRSDLTTWLGKIDDPEDRFTAYQLQGALRSLEGSMERIAELRPAMSKVLTAARHETGPLSIGNLETEITRLSSIFGGGVPTIPDLNTAAIIAKGDKLLWKRHETSAARYAGAVGDDVRHLFAVGVAKGETFQQLTTRLLRTGNPATRISPIDPGRDGAAIGDALAQRAVTQADRLVRTEMMHAYNVQHDEAIRSANKNRIDGTPQYLRRWDAAADIRVCPICAGLDGKTTTIDGSFPGGYGSPPAHPYCRCVVLAWSPEWGDMPGETKSTGGIDEEQAKQVKTPAKTPARKPRSKDKDTIVEPEAKAPTAPQPPATKPKRGPKPLPQLAEVGQMAAPGQEILAALKRGDPAAAVDLINHQIAARGMQNRGDPNQHDVKITNEGMEMVSHSGNKITARAFRNWDGSMRLSPRVGEEIQTFIAVSENKHAGELTDALTSHANALYSHRMGAAKAARDNIPQGDWKRIGELQLSGNGIKTLVHETLHGFSPVEAMAYRGAAGQIEEFTTETLARVMARDLFGIPVAQWDKGSYALDITAATSAIAKVTGNTMERSFELLAETSQRFKARTGKIGDPDDVVKAFAMDLQHVTKAHPGRIINELTNQLQHAADQAAKIAAGH